MKNYATFVITLGLLAGLTMGCRSTDSAKSGHLASVTLTGHPREQIWAATVRAFEDHGYQRLSGLTFERKGTGMDTAAYGGWSGQPVWFRVVVELSARSGDTQTLGANGFMILDRDDPAMREEHKLLWSKRKELKALLNEIKQRMDAPPP